MSAAAILGERPEPGAFTSALLSAAVHLLLLAVLLFGVRWQNRPPEAVEVELWVPPPPAPVVEAPKPEPLPKVEPAPPPKPEPVIPKPEIVEKAPPPKPKPVPKVEPKPVPPKPVAKAEIKPPPKPVAKAEPLRPRVDFREELMREQAAIQIERDRQMLRDLKGTPGTPPSENTKAQAAWIDKVRAKIRGNIVLPPEIKGNPEAIFAVAQLPNGDVLTVRLKKSSGLPALDAAIERAVLKSTPLPKPDSGFTAPREFELRYKPLE